MLPFALAAPNRNTEPLVGKAATALALAPSTVFAIAGSAPREHSRRARNQTKRDNLLPIHAFKLLLCPKEATGGLALMAE
jgi:hypothetical protein